MSDAPEIDVQLYAHGVHLQIGDPDEEGGAISISFDHPTFDAVVEQFAQARANKAGRELLKVPVSKIHTGPDGDLIMGRRVRSVTRTIQPKKEPWFFVQCEGDYELDFNLDIAADQMVEVERVIQ